MTSKNQKYSAKNITLMGILFALAIVFSFLESLLPAIWALPVGAKLGLSNIVTMFCLFSLGSKKAITLTLLKSLFVLFTRGPIAAALSLGGGICSVLVMHLLLRTKKERISYLLISVFGAVFHNVGQLLVATIVLGTSRVFGYLPIMGITGIIMGTITGFVLRAVMPYLFKLAK